MKINENQWKSRKTIEYQWTLMNINTDSGKSMKTNENQWKSMTDMAITTFEGIHCTPLSWSFPVEPERGSLTHVQARAAV